ncbi:MULTISPECIES: helix-turn-helix transcriptional regulator [Streptomyces]|uniref:helix-turn-helix domain-containing protein n=1 Tax=Streptomyces TaxID=1883 RepID=UPI000E0495A9|nr:MULTISPECIES: helix-turn-helix transcriptional regulator [Streptomyces]MBT3074361.1 helix-turn-helix transcriptional regulator [Streptomyces sp. COG21]MBT3083177.1 helix-turn-helix transcriptional regulator [Streptomyces sp. COG20]MBT3090781.1 helix-turn-helix transcriptional regulator [Streptomyces sp. CYG21]MBT3096159.1 helix-turn-helix transcriptional regulator [Streptomyces sp. CBG30]MBT3105370.1 helix-turn-helix transcriptional regulator [Streptomyces sp. COG19]
MNFEPERLGQSRSDLAEALRSLRKRAGKTQSWLARRCNMSQTRVSNMESGKLTPVIVDVELILEALGTDDPAASQILEMVRTANTEWQDHWSSRRRGLDKKQNELARIETVTTEFRFFLLSAITGLLATPDYVRASLAGTPGDQSKTIAKKLERQSVLHDSSKSFTFLLTEQAVRWPLLSPLAMAVQLDRLASVSRIPHVRLGVIPLAGHISEMPLSTFTLYDRRLATVETGTGVLVLRDHRDVNTYREDFERYESYAVFGDECRELLDEWSRVFTRQRQ